MHVIRKHDKGRDTLERMPQECVRVATQGGNGVERWKPFGAEARDITFQDAAAAHGLLARLSLSRRLAEAKNSDALVALLAARHA